MLILCPLARRHRPAVQVRTNGTVSTVEPVPRPHGLNLFLSRLLYTESLSGCLFSYSYTPQGGTAFKYPEKPFSFNSLWIQMGFELLEGGRANAVYRLKHSCWLLLINRLKRSALWTTLIIINDVNADSLEEEILCIKSIVLVQ